MSDHAKETFKVGMQYDPGVYLIKDQQNVLHGGLFVSQDPNNPNHKLEYWAIAPNYVPLGGANVNRGPLTFPYQANLQTLNDLLNYLNQNNLGNTVHIMASCTTGGW
jgi:hypothetical protein